MLEIDLIGDAGYAGGAAQRGPVDRKDHGGPRIGRRRARNVLHAGRFRHARTGVEIKASATVTAHDFAALHALQSQLGERFQPGIVLYLDEHVAPFGDKIWLAPLPTLWGHNLN